MLSWYHDNRANLKLMSSVLYFHNNKRYINAILCREKLLCVKQSQVKILSFGLREAPLESHIMWLIEQCL